MEEVEAPRLTPSEQNELFRQALATLFAETSFPDRVGVNLATREIWRARALTHARYYGPKMLGYELIGTGVPMEQVQAIAALIYDGQHARIT